MRRLVPRLLAVVALALAGLYGVSLAQVWRTGQRDGRRPADAIVVLGAAQYDGTPSPVLRRRLDHVVALYEDGVADTVVVTGGKQPGDRFTEATASATYLRARGIPEDRILREVRGRTSWESLGDAAAFLRQRGMRRVVLVSDRSHAARIDGIAGELGLDATVSPTPGSGGHAAEYVKEAGVVAAAKVVGYRRMSGVADRVRTAA